jgi:hypothetical protein
LFYNRPLKHGAAVRSELGLREDGTMRRSVADRRLRGGLPSIGLARSRPCSQPGASIHKRVSIVGGGVVDPSHSGNLRPRLIGYSRSKRDPNAPVTLPPQNRIRLAIKLRRSGVGTGSDCGEAFGARGRLCLGFVGSDAASSTASDFAPERVVRIGLEVASTSPSTCSESVSAGVGAGASSALGFRPRPSCFAKVDRCSE